MKRIMIVEDEPFMREELLQMFGKAGYEAEAVTDFENAAAVIAREAPDLAVLDLNLPGPSGFEICRELKLKSTVPVLVLTARDQMKDELHALHLGADEYLTKPCRKERLLARTANVLKRYEGRSNLLEGDGFLLDRKTYTLYADRNAAVLTPNQGKLLEVLMTCGEKAASKEELCTAIWGTSEFIDENALQVNLGRLKKVMASLSMKQQIVSLRGIGYRLGKEEGHEA